LVLASCAASIAGGFGGACGGAGSQVACEDPALSDPFFSTDTTWTSVRGAALAPGAATFTAPTMCDHGGVVQTLPASRLACARPLVLSFDITLLDEDRTSFAAGVGGGWNLPVVPLGEETLKVCLGANAFGGSVDLFLGPGVDPWVCPPPATGGPSISLSRVSIDPDDAGACPAPGTVPDGDFELGAQGWAPKLGNGVVEVVPGGGENGSAALHLATTYLCQKPSISEAISLPSARMIPHPALRLWSKGSTNAALSVRVGSLITAFYTGATYLPGTGAARTSSLCIPRWAQGTVQPLELAFVPTLFTEECAAEDGRDFLVDGIGFESEPRCADADLFDPGFELAADAAGPAPALATRLASTWTLERYDDQPGSDVTIASGDPGAHSGKAFARFSASSPCPRASVSTSVTVPTPAGGAGPVLKLWYETNVGANDTLSVSLNELGAPTQLPLAPSWTQATFCLDPHLAGRPELLRVTLTNVSGGGNCADTFPAETVGLDDVELGTDPACPAL
jgi:hypothetical protein